ncbi:MAG: S41 family peptidase [Parcubacteria group bacterium]
MEFWRNYKETVLACIIVAGIFFTLGLNVGERDKEVVVLGVLNQELGAASVDFAPFWKAWNVLNEKYVSATTSEQTTDEDKVWGAIKGLTSSYGDPYTVFFPPVESEMFASDIRGNFEGVGMEIVAKEGALTVVAPLKNSPAERAGLLPGDKILKIDDMETSNLSTEEAVRLIRGPRGTPVILTIYREGRSAPFDISVTRDVINIPTIATRLLPEGIFLIELYSFSENSPNLFRGALRQFVEARSSKLILDLRGNPGGYLEASIDMASWFLPSGKVVVRESFGDGREEKAYRSKGYDVFNDKLQFVILVDGGSASASEILAGALAEHGEAILIGDTTFGKGSVQELVSITPKTSLKVTIAHWLTPLGKSISNQGITPDIVVKRTEEDILAGRDPQLERAIQYLQTGE